MLTHWPQCLWDPTLSVPNDFYSLATPPVHCSLLGRNERHPGDFITWQSRLCVIPHLNSTVSSLPPLAILTGQAMVGISVLFITMVAMPSCITKQGSFNKGEVVREEGPALLMWCDAQRAKHSKQWPHPSDFLANKIHKNCAMKKKSEMLMTHLGDKC